ncbi:MAG: Zinc-binding GTPase YeiR [Verrucomicrobia subdivision 3 bacterium]|nr:Zinc-binding GTPase YeiR [Limisphaerales bacterium]MCS1415414.1 Zinc-binding GTPase YeiR [Limisphaerales bacterium]
MIGGFLGAGKTTAVAQLAKYVSDQGLKVALITNDQGTGLVDTVALRSRGYATEEISGGCFCCRFNSLMDAANRLTEALQPDVFVAEPVGSCTDLVATVTYPLRRVYGNHFQMAPLSVLVDPIRAQRVMGLADGGRFSDKVAYIYRKQLEEANLIVINKVDLLDAAGLQELRACLTGSFPRARVLDISARGGEGLEAWFQIVTDEEQAGEPTTEVDYDVYADGEALLGWLNATIEVRGDEAFDGNALVQEIAGALQHRLRAASAEIAHLKMTLTPSRSLGGLAVINLVRNDIVPELGQRLDDALQEGQLILNLRAEAAPEMLEGIVRAALEEITLARVNGLSLVVDDLERFRPGRPEPTHRDQFAATTSG